MYRVSNEWHKVREQRRRCGRHNHVANFVVVARRVVNTLSDIQDRVRHSRLDTRARQTGIHAAQDALVAEEAQQSRVLRGPCVAQIQEGRWRLDTVLGERLQTREYNVVEDARAERRPVDVGVAHKISKSPKGRPAEQAHRRIAGLGARCDRNDHMHEARHRGSKRLA